MPGRRTEHVSVELRQGGVVSVSGELDVASASLLIAMLEHARRTSRPPAADRSTSRVVVDVDLTGVTFVDSIGLASVTDSPTRIVGASPAVRHLLFLLRAG